jgi:uncharacterized membrane protein
MKRGSVLGALLSAVGADLLTRGVTGHYLHDILGIPALMGRTEGRIPHQLGVKVDTSVTAGVSPEEAYRFVRNFENLPRFLRHVETVETVDERHSRWVIREPGGLEVEWYMEVINDVPNELIAWRSMENARVESAGSIHFEKSRGGATVRVELQYLPLAGALGAVVAKLLGHDPEQQLRDDLLRLKEILESGESRSVERQRGGSDARSQAAGA